LSRSASPFFCDGFFFEIGSHELFFPRLISAS
jgi:hypothetical protein